MVAIGGGEACECVLCPEFVGRPDTDFHRRTSHRIPTRILVTRNGFTIVPDIAPMVTGHVLIATTAHQMAMSMLDQAMLEELDNTMTLTASILAESFHAPTIFFEHGPIDEFDRAGCCVDHAHMHALPVTVDVTPSLRKLYDEIPLHRLDELQRFAQQHQPYLFFQRTNGEKLAYAPVYAVSQVIRRLICMELRLPGHSTWENAIDVTRIEQTLAALKVRFESAAVEHVGR
jgi:diadenosine tetraphosphate (Ap4A) HIT family hydrolase